MGQRYFHRYRVDESGAFTPLTVAGEATSPLNCLPIVRGWGFAKGDRQGNTHRNPPQDVGKETLPSVTSEGRPSRGSSGERIGRSVALGKILGFRSAGVLIRLLCRLKP